VLPAACGLTPNGNLALTVVVSNARRDEISAAGLHRRTNPDLELYRHHCGGMATPAEIQGCNEQDMAGTAPASVACSFRSVRKCGQISAVASRFFFGAQNPSPNLLSLRHERSEIP
jgi:hypothetical protein